MILLTRRKIITGAPPANQLARPVIALVNKTSTSAVLSIAPVPNATIYIWWRGGIRVQESSSLTLSLSNLPPSTNQVISCMAQAAGYQNSPIDGYTFVTNAAPVVDPVGAVALQIQMSSAAGATAAIPLLKYNKQKAITFDYDDGSFSSVENKSKLDSTTFTDGCGNNIPFTAGVFLNILNPGGAELPALPENEAHAAGNITYDDAKDLIAAGWDIGNHGYKHIDGGTESYTDQDLVDLCDEAIFNNTDYKPNTLVVPTNYGGFTQAAANRGYVCSLSQADETADGWPQWDNQWNYIRRISVLNAVSNLFWMKRDFATSWSNGNNAFTNLTNLNSASTASWLGMGTHGMSSGERTVFNSWLDQIKAQMGDDIIFTSAREFAEYQHLRQTIDKSESVSGNNLNVALDFTDVPNKQRLSWYDLSFVIGGTGTIQNVTCDDDRFTVTFNPTTRLVNIRYRKTNFTDEVVEPEPENRDAILDAVDVAYFFDDALNGAGQPATEGEVVATIAAAKGGVNLPYTGIPAPQLGLPTKLGKGVEFLNHSECYFAAPLPGTTQGSPKALPEEFTLVFRHMPGQGWEAIQSLPGSFYIGFGGTSQFRGIDSTIWFPGNPALQYLQVSVIHCLVEAYSGTGVQIRLWYNGQDIGTVSAATVSPGITTRRYMLTAGIYTHVTEHIMLGIFHRFSKFTDAERTAYLNEINGYFGLGDMPTKPYAANVGFTSSGSTRTATYNYVGSNPENTAAVDIKWFARSGSPFNYEPIGTGKVITYSGGGTIIPMIKVFDNQGNSWRWMSPVM
ncbi:hypothetical protein ABDK00_001705 [Niabella insulamsoli]|uniref:hypothetical protein n=1 Tax=Niabella insulamsoli TaxID=3144874 RepID=UPI0031FC4EFD